MSEGFLNCAVSINCGDTLGIYQGDVVAVDTGSQTLTINNAFRNGKRCTVPEITLGVQDIKSIDILMTPDEVKKRPAILKAPANTYQFDEPAPALAPTPAKSMTKNASYPQFKNPPRHSPNSFEVNGQYRVSSPTNKQRADKLARSGKNLASSNPTSNGATSVTPNKDDTFRRRTNSASEYGSRRKASTPRKIENGHHQTRRGKGATTFGTPTNGMSDDFDFEQNLKLFDKHAIFEEIEAMGGVGLVPEVNPDPKQVAKYRCDENVLNSAPVVYRQINVPSSTDREYLTDSGLVVPCVDLELRTKLLTAATAAGYSEERQLEMVGRSAGEMVMQLLGGANRLTPKNAHQKPTVVVLCGPHRQGAYALNCARHLSSHGVSVNIFVPKYKKIPSELDQELKLYALTTGKRCAETSELPTTVDLMITGLESHFTNYAAEPLFQHIITWANQCKAPTLAIDPPIHGSSIASKWSLQIALPLPLSDSCGRVYLCDLGIPSQLFNTCGIHYRSPFSHKYCIALNPSV